MSRTTNTAPLRVQSWSLPTWATSEWHTRGCLHGTEPCSLSRAGDVAWSPRRPDCCTRWALYYCGPAGGSRRNQGSYAKQLERSARAATRAQLRAAVKAANGARGEDRFDDGTVECLWDLDVDARPRSVEWLMW